MSRLSPKPVQDSDPAETREWIESLTSVLESEGVERTHFILERLIDYARRSGVRLPYDHRVIDGVKGARFTTRLAEILADREQFYKFFSLKG